MSSYLFNMHSWNAKLNILNSQMKQFIGFPGRYSCLIIWILFISILHSRAMNWHLIYVIFDKFPLNLCCLCYMKREVIEISLAALITNFSLHLMIYSAFIQLFQHKLNLFSLFSTNSAYLAQILHKFTEIFNCNSFYSAAIQLIQR